MKKLVRGGVVLIAVLAALAAPMASDAPDGLERVAADEGFATTERDHALDGGPLAGYEVEGVGDPDAATGAAAVVGVLLAFGASTVAFRLLGRRRRGDGP